MARVQGVGVQIASHTSLSFHWVTKRAEEGNLFGPASCKTLPAACLSTASLRVQTCQKAASCRSAGCRLMCCCSSILNIDSASPRQFFRERITSISQPTSPSLLTSSAISSPLWLRLNRGSLLSRKAGLPFLPWIISATAEADAIRRSSVRPASQDARRGPTGAYAIISAGSDASLRAEISPTVS